MAQFQDARGNEWQGALDALNNSTLTDARTATSNLAAANSTVVVDIVGKATVTFAVSCVVTMAANDLVVEGTLDGTNFFALSFWVQSSTIGSLPSQAVGATISPTAMTAGQLCVVTCSATGWRQVRMRKVSATGNANVNLRASAADFRILAQPQPTTLWVTATGAVNTAVTATLPAAPGLFHHITSVQLVKLYSVVGVASGAGTIITSTNMPGNPSWTTEQLASAAGTAPAVISIQSGSNPIRSLASAAGTGTATTFVAPAQLQTIWRWNIGYYLGE